MKLTTTENCITVSLYFIYKLKQSRKKSPNRGHTTFLQKNVENGFIQVGLKSVAKVWFVGIGDIYYHSESNPDTISINTECSRASLPPQKGNGLQFELENICVISHSFQSGRLTGLWQIKMHNIPLTPWICCTSLKNWPDPNILAHVWSFVMQSKD